jgi:hypothetical protein
MVRQAQDRPFEGLNQGFFLKEPLDAGCRLSVSILLRSNRAVSGCAFRFLEERAVIGSRH